MAFSEPDLYFEAALENYTQGNLGIAAEDIGEAISFLQELEFEEDTANAPILAFAASELENLQNDLYASNVDSEDVLNDAFASANISIASYHLAIVEDYYKNGNAKKEGLERLHRAMIRLDKAVSYQGYQLSDEEKSEMEVIRSLIAKSEKSSPDLWNRVNTFFKKVDQKISGDDDGSKKGQ